MSKGEYIIASEKLIHTLEQKSYFSAALPAYHRAIAEIREQLMNGGADMSSADTQAEKEVLSHLHDVMREAQPLVENFIAARVASGVIRSADQARKSAAGNIFQQMFAYAIAKNVLNGNITVPITVTMSVSGIIDKYAAIAVGDDIQKPDSDVIIYCDENENSPILNFSCKTSCRERAGQTYKWKLLCDLATCRCDYREGNTNCPATKYNLSYAPAREIKMCFVTTDFYNELNNPQISAMFHFFNHTYVAKPVSPAANIQILQDVIADINSCF